MALTLLRHAAPSERYQKTYLGWSDVDIDETLFDASSLSLLHASSFDCIYSSDLKRCTQTLDRLGFTYTSDARLREVKFKEEIEMKRFEEIEKLPSFSPEYLSSEAAWFSYISEESAAHFSQRVQSFLDELNPKHTTLICAHKGTLNHILQCLGKKPFRFDYLEAYCL
ncbi:histidine phosphatase family protein [Sulfurospirillum barnesii]|uniref:Fructose-2,6-bisphosphatase n=1 Tax=Sulfurospirillum barnesii (strain ATCC 700032 / DSM 10660 / SES-3) TaxID=760154 RepID=I3XZP1_SULBS|nr:histidine phosphatase family protein [Sulfurospirillum barnesii]AFL69415.1 fructose-2,6-bisphosphatase [Sulfurospirillum barnesii SES-3]